MCREYGIYVEAQENMGSLKEMIDKAVDKLGNKSTKVTAFRKISETAFKNYMKMATEFGLTPSSFSRLSVAKPNESTDPMKEFL